MQEQQTEAVNQDNIGAILDEKQIYILPKRGSRRRTRGMFPVKDPERKEHHPYQTHGVQIVLK